MTNKSLTMTKDYVVITAARSRGGGVTAPDQRIRRVAPRGPAERATHPLGPGNQNPVFHEAAWHPDGDQYLSWPVGGHQIPGPQDRSPGQRPGLTRLGWETLTN